MGELTKAEIRKIAEENGLITAKKKDSTGVCFIGERNFKRFLMQYLPAQPGDMCTLDGKVVGKHDGLMFYTLGQRRGLGLGGEGESWFVIRKDLEKNILYVNRGEHESLFTKTLRASGASFVAGSAPGDTFRAGAKVRYRQADQMCTVHVNGDELFIEFDQPQRAVTPGQYVVLYSGDVCLGAASIDQA